MGDIASELAMVFDLQTAEQTNDAKPPEVTIKAAHPVRRPDTAPTACTTIADIPQDVMTRISLAARPLAGESYHKKNPFWIYRIAWGHMFGRACMDCGNRMIFSTEVSAPPQVWGMLATIDHIQQRASGGSDAQNNLQVICACCNGLRQLSHPRQAKKATGKASSSLILRRDHALLHAYDYLWPCRAWDEDDLSHS